MNALNKALKIHDNYVKKYNLKFLIKRVVDVYM